MNHTMDQHSIHPIISSFFCFQTKTAEHLPRLSLVYLKCRALVQLEFTVTFVSKKHEALFKYKSPLIFPLLGKVRDSHTSSLSRCEKTRGPRRAGVTRPSPTPGTVLHSWVGTSPAPPPPPPPGAFLRCSPYPCGPGDLYNTCFV